MSWKNLSLPLQSLIFGAAVAFLAWLFSPYLPSSRYSGVPRDAFGAQIGAGNPFGREPDDLSGPRPGGRTDDGTGRGLPGKGR
jgi:hypothetical protein